MFVILFSCVPNFFIGPWEPYGFGHQEFLHSLRVYGGVGWLMGVVRLSGHDL